MVKHHILVVFAIVSLAKPTLGAEVNLGPEVPLCSKVELRGATGAQTAPAVASNGRDFVAVWVDDRKQSGEIFATRVGEEGRPADLLGRTIAEGTSPKIASAGGDYVAVWGTDASGIQSVRLDENGVPVTSPRTVNAGSPRALVSNGSNYLLVMDYAGVLLDRDGTRLFSVAKSFAAPFAAGVHGGRYVLVDAPGTLLRTIGDDGSVADVIAPLSNPPAAVEGTAAFSPDAILIAWSSGAYAVVRYDGTVIRQVTALAGLKATERHAAAGWDGHQFLLSFSRQDVFRIASDGTPIDATPFALSPYELRDLAFASNGTTQLLAWSETHALTDQDLVGRAVTDFDALAALSAPAQPLTFSGPPQKDVRIARGPTGLFGVWTDDKRSALSGAFNGAPVTIDATDPGSIDAPAIAAGSRVFLVVWRRAGSLLAKRFDFSGSDLDPQPLTLFSNSTEPQASIAFDGDAFFVAWTTRTNLHSVRVGEGGQPFDARDTSLTVSGASSFVNYPAHSARAFWTGSQFFVGYAYDYNFGLHDFTGSSALSAVRFDPSGVIQQPASIVSHLGRASVRLSAALGDQNIVFAWVNDAEFRIEAAQTAFDATLARSAKPVFSFTRFEPVPTKIVEVGWTGSEFVLVWPQRIGGKATLLGMRLDAGFSLIDSAPFEIASPVDAGTAPSLIRTATGVLIGYSRVDEASGGALRAFARTLDHNVRPAHRRAVGR